jgi:hypothetical protein
MRRLIGWVALCAAACGGSHSITNVHCESDPVLAGTGCECSAGGAATTFDCSETGLAHTTCCADPSWPLVGSCACLPNQPTCIQSTASASCLCFVGNTLSGADALVMSCSAQQGGRCCSAGDEIGTCNCNIDCSNDEVPVAACVPSAVTICPQGSNHVASCSTSP